MIALAYASVFVAVRLTPFGAHLLAIGNSEARARLAGIGVRRVQVAAFVISGGLCGLAASFYVATYRNVEMTIGATLALDAVAAVVLGGTAVTGGRISLLARCLLAFSCGFFRMTCSRRGAVAVATRGDGAPVARARRRGLVGAAARAASSVGSRRAQREPCDDASCLADPVLGLLWVVVVTGLAVLKPGA